MVRFKGGSPKSMRQGQYWLRRHLGDQKRAAAAQRRAATAAERDRNANARAAIAEEREREHIERKYAAAKRRLALWEHFEKAQNQLKIALDCLTTGQNDTYQMQIAFASEEEAEKLEKLQRAYQGHSDWLNENHQSMTATALSKHIQNIKKMLMQLGKGHGKRTRWNPQDQTFIFGDLTLDFSEPAPSGSAVRRIELPAFVEPREQPEALIAPVGIFHPMFPVIAVLVLFVAACVSLLN